MSHTKHTHTLGPNTEAEREWWGVSPTNTHMQNLRMVTLVGGWALSSHTHPWWVASPTNTHMQNLAWKHE